MKYCFIFSFFLYALASSQADTTWKHINKSEQRRQREEIEQKKEKQASPAKKRIYQSQQCIVKRIRKTRHHQVLLTERVVKEYRGVASGFIGTGVRYRACQRAKNRCENDPARVIETDECKI